MNRLTEKDFDGEGYHLKVSGREHRYDAFDRLAAYEDTGLEPEDIISAQDMFKIAGALHELNAYKDLGPIDRLRELAQADREGRVVVLDEKTALSLLAGARAIENNKRLLGAIYCYDIFGKLGGPKEVSYYEAAKILREAAEAALGGGGDV